MMSLAWDISAARLPLGSMELHVVAVVSASPWTNPLRHFIIGGVGSKAMRGCGGKTTSSIPCCLKKLDTRRVRAHVVLIPHILKAIITFPIRVRSDFLKKNVKNIPCCRA